LRTLGGLFGCVLRANSDPTPFEHLTFALIITRGTRRDGTKIEAFAATKELTLFSL
jgi:hypothetical protein